MKRFLPSRPVRSARLPATVLSAVLLGTGLSACAPLLVGGAMGGTALLVTDRRTSGAQLEDQGIELRAANRLRDKVGENSRVEVISYNRQVLLVGEVPSEEDKMAAEKAVAGVENVQSIVNELGVMSVASFRERSNDTLITGRVKASMLDARDIFSNAFKVVTNRGTVFLMGRVTQREADRATMIARNTSGVQKVVLTLEVISEDELAGIQARQGQEVKK